jgi:hypothetical protein
MQTLLLEPTTPMNALFSFMGAGDVLRIVKEDDGRPPIIKPVIDPADYDNDTDYINAVPGWADAILASRASPQSEDEDWD